MTADTDNVQERTEAIEARFHFLQLFEGGIFSHKVGVRKPDPKIYELALQVVGKPAKEVVFIDDKPTALEPARQLGMQTIHFTDAAAVRQSLQELGVQL